MILRGKKERFLGSEKELCAWFNQIAVSGGWTVYPETAGWDMLLVRDFCGKKIFAGVQAKLHYNIHVIEQVLQNSSQVHHKVVLVPDANSSIVTVALGMVIIRWKRDAESVFLTNYEKFHEIGCPEFYFPVDNDKIPWTPDVCPDWLPSGDSSPRRIGVWMQNAIKLLAHAKLNGGKLRTDDFFRYKMRAGLWTRNGWVEKIKKEDGRHWLYSVPEKGNARNPRPDMIHPEYLEKMIEKMRAESEKSN
jgi:hypothetical protein